MPREKYLPTPVELYRYPDPDLSRDAAIHLVQSILKRLGYRRTREGSVSKGITREAQIIDIVYDVVESFLYSPNPALYLFDENATFKDLEESVYLTCKKRLPSILNNRKLWDTKFVICQPGETKKRETKKRFISRERRWGTKNIRPQKLRKSEVEKSVADLSDDYVLDGIIKLYDLRAVINSSHVILIKHWISKLDPRQQQVLSLRLQNYTQSEIGKRMKIKQVTVSRVEARAIELLRKFLRNIELQ